MKRLALAAVLAVLALAGTAQAAYNPTPGTTWQWQLTGTIDTSVAAQAFDIDAVDAPTAKINTLKAQGRALICYISAGSWENWRPDASKFPAVVKGRNLDGWAGEKWLDIRRWDILGPLMQARMQNCVDRGFDAVEPDNVDGYTNRTGFPLTAADQLAYNKNLAATAHALGLGVALKNDVDQVAQLEPYFDFAINEEAVRYKEYQPYAVFINAGKAVFHVEYGLSTGAFCPIGNSMGFSSMKKKLSLNAYRVTCW